MQQFQKSTKYELLNLYKIQNKAMLLFFEKLTIVYELFQTFSKQIFILFESIFELLVYFVQ